MNITSQYFLALFEEFKKVKPAKINVYIEIASGRIPESVWETSTKYATALLTAHMLSTSGPQGGGSAGGPVTAEQVGDLSRAYGSVAEVGSADAFLATTRYGIDLIALRRETFTTGMSTYQSGARRVCRGDY